MVCVLTETFKAAALFAGWEDTAILSCLEGIMGKVFVTDPESPRSAMAYIGCYAFYAGEPDTELVLNKPEGFTIMVPQHEGWAKLIESAYPHAEKAIRYATRKDTVFDRDRLRAMTALPEGYELRKLDAELYDRCVAEPALYNQVGVFGSKEEFLRLGRGVSVVKNGRVVAGASSYSRYSKGLEVEVDTLEAERRKGLARAAAAALILSCLEEGLYPSWDAGNRASLGLAEKLGYEFSHEYVSYESD